MVDAGDETFFPIKSHGNISALVRLTCDQGPEWDSLLGIVHTRLKSAANILNVILGRQRANTTRLRLVNRKELQITLQDHCYRMKGVDI